MNQTPDKKFTNWLQSLKRKSYIKECFHSDENCLLPIKLAHSIQNNRILNKIAVNGEVLCIEHLEENGDIKLILKKTGRKKATTFTGFCNYHDTKIFIPIESKDYQERDKEQEFIFAYRALAKEYHVKKTSIEILKRAINNTSPQVPAREILELHLEGCQIAMKELEQNKIMFNTALEQKNFEIIETRVIKFYGEFLLAVSSFFAIEQDLKGNIINDISNFNKELKYFCLTIFPQNGKTYILLSYLKKNKKVLAPVIKQISEKSIAEQKIIFSNIVAIYVENFVLSPEKWEKMSDAEKSVFLNLYKETIPFPKESLSQARNINLFL
ncbi:MAG TPA: hypothetical protein VK184_13950 [Nostocaceae cyanobacterium]|nr:hypothetical protein [Nostocaceae cyanobacterium]